MNPGYIGSTSYDGTIKSAGGSKIEIIGRVQEVSIRVVNKKSHLHH
jgi:hypothetical protein